jgi:hypothetical protein
MKRLLILTSLSGVCPDNVGLMRCVCSGSNVATTLFMVGSGGRNEQHARDISREVITLKTKTFELVNRKLSVLNSKRVTAE